MNKPLTLSERKRQSVLDAAIELFHQHGYQKTSMDQVAALAQVSKRTVYNHFASKEALFKAITEIIWEKGLQATEYVYNPLEPLHEQLSKIAKQELELLKSESYLKLSRIVIGECISDESTAAGILSQLETAESGLKKWIIAASADGRLSDEDPDFISEQFFALIKSFAFWPQVIGYRDCPNEVESERIIARTVDMILDQYEVVSE